MQDKYRILIGGIGDDAHSVGIGLLSLGLKEAGFDVTNIGIRNEIEDFFRKADGFDIFLVSNKNGHAELYLENFASELAALKLRDDKPRLWYLGGSLSVSESDFSIKKKFLQQGFTNVYPKTISFKQVVDDMRQDIHRHEIKPSPARNSEFAGSKKLDFNANKVVNRMLTEEELSELRKEVVTEWRTGLELLTSDFTDGQYKKIETLDRALWNNKMRGGRPLLQPRTGVADIDEQVSLLQFLESSGSDISSVQLDAASRSRMYDKAEEAVFLSKERKRSQLNGFPIPVYGPKRVQGMLQKLRRPFQLRAGGSDHRFVYEVALKAGITAVEGGLICYSLPYEKTANPIQSLKNWQYIDRLCTKFHQESGVAINREYFGVLTATLIEPTLAIVVNIVQAILSAQQGIKSISVGYAEQGNRVQDIAAIQVLEETVKSYLKRYGFNDVRVTTVYHQFMAAFPSDRNKAEELIRNSSITATLAGATKMMVKTVVEALKIPDRYDNAHAVKVSRQGTMMAAAYQVDQEALGLEKRLLFKQVKATIEAILELGNGSVAEGAVKAIEQGLIDIPWSPNQYNRNEVVTVRDAEGAVRFHNFGNLPFDSDTKAFHNEKVHLRKTLEREPSVFNLLENDLSRIWKNDYKYWPLDGHYVR